MNCTPPPRYDGLYVDRDCFYKNYDIGMTVRFPGKWRIETDPRKMNRSARSFARSLGLFGSDLLFSGVTADGNQAVRCIVENANMTVSEYAEGVRKANRREVNDDSEMTVIEPGSGGPIRWEYSVGAYRFAEYFYKFDTYDIRMAFWTNRSTFERFRSVYDETAKAVKNVSGGPD